MPLLQVNFDEVPDQIVPVAPGVYILSVSEAKLEPTKDGLGQKVVVQLKVDDEASPEHGRIVFDHISTKMTTKLKRLGKSCGLTMGAQGLNVEDLIGKHCKARIKNRVYKDDNGEMKESSSVEDYLFE